jgi:hypothetical protein
LSERDSASRNFALAYFMKENKCKLYLIIWLKAQFQAFRRA